MRTLLVALGMVTGSVWVGSLVCLAVVSAAATSTLDPHSRIALFRRVGRLYGIVGFGSLLVTIAAGLTLAWPPSAMDRRVVSIFALATVLVLATVLGMAQARRMTAHRRALLARPRDPAAVRRVHRGSQVAGALRGALAVITIVIIVMGADVLTH